MKVKTEEQYIVQGWVPNGCQIPHSMPYLHNLLSPHCNPMRWHYSSTLRINVFNNVPSLQQAAMPVSPQNHSFNQIHQIQAWHQENYYGILNPAGRDEIGSTGNSIMVTHQSYVSLAHFLLQVSPFSRQLVSIFLPISQERKARCQGV